MRGSQREKLTQTKNVVSWQSFISLHLKLLDIDHPLTCEESKLRQVEAYASIYLRTTKEFWIDVQYQDIEDNIRKNNSKKAYQLVKTLASKKQGKPTPYRTKAGIAYRNQRHSKEVDRILYRTVQPHSRR